MNDITRRILCVDDDPMLLEGLRRNLRKKFNITTAAGGEAGLTALREQGPFAVVTSDYRMPGMDGVEFLRQAHAIAPETVLVMLTGQAELNVAVSALHKGHIFKFLTKPAPPEVLESTLGDCLEQYRLVVSEKNLRRELDLANEELRALNQNLERLVARRTATIQGLYRLVSDLNGLESLDDVAQAIVARTADMLHSQRVVLLMPDVGREQLAVRAAVGLDAAECAKTQIQIESSVEGMVYSNGQCLVANEAADLAELEGNCRPEELLRTPLALAALLTSDGSVGVLGMSEPLESASYEAEGLAALKTIAEAAGIALLNQIRREERDDARDATILALAKLAEHRDPETGAHLERVQCYCRLISETLAGMERYNGVITRSFIETIVRSSPLHDIGKVGIPDQILLKPGKLTPEEFEIMKRHSKIGGDTIRALIEQGRRQSFLQMGMEIAYYHHEKYDGTGYPSGLAGDVIPLSARILALADVYDALTTRRVYKPPMSHAQAFSLITTGAGRHFDPDVVAAFEQKAREFERLSAALAEPSPPAMPSAEDAAARA